MISIALASYNGEKYIKEQIDSIIAQTITDWELIISDDGSKDSTLKIIQNYAQNDSRIKIIENIGEHGCSKNFENALKYCNGKYIAFCDQDDVWTDDHLEHLMSIIGNKSLAFANAEAVDVKLNSLNFFWGGKFMITESHISNEVFLHLIFLNFVQGTAILFKRELLDFLPFPEILFHDHWAAISAVLKNGIAYSSKSVLKYRQHGNNVCGIMNRSLIYKIKHLNSEKKRRIDFYYIISNFVNTHKDLLSSEKQKMAYKSLEIARKILFKGSIISFKKYYDMLFWDSDRSKFFSRYLMYCFPVYFFDRRKR